MAAEYGFTINVSGNSIQQLKSIEAELGRLGLSAKSAGRSAVESLAPMEDKLKEIGTKLAELFAIREVFNFGKEILNVTAEFEGFENRIKFASLNTYDAAQNMSFLREEVEKLHIPMRQAYEGFSEMQAGLVGTGIEGDRLRSLFEGISTAAATLHLPEFQLQRTLYDLKEIGEVGINMRIARSLSTALPGIGNIVKEAFGKSMIELEHSGMSGGEFLAKLGPALKEHFEKGLANFGDSLQARLTDVKNTSLKTMLDLGQQLEPTFKSILSGIADAFNSEPVKFFTAHIADLVSLIERAIPIWLAYKGIMLLGTIATGAQTLALQLLEGAQMTAMFGLEGLTVAAEGFGISLASTGVGAFAVAIGLLVGQMVSLNAQVDQWVEKVSGLKGFISQTDQIKTDVDRITGTANNPLSTTEDKQSALADALHRMPDVALAIRQLTPQLDKTKDAYERANNLTGDITGLDRWVTGLTSPQIKEEDKLSVAYKDEQQRMTELKEELIRLNGTIEALRKAGIKVPASLPLSGGTTGGGLHGSHLSGAEGGLNQARIVNLRIDTVMKVTEASGKDITKHAVEAADYIVRAMNNLSETKSGTF